ncbi:hypothetical protein NP493_532g03011 [Ridgeia piscesae]|uniref:Uncharacterized protein n=1 Tax=Ridgeia piscesae TaxID=27915 RepID=A0AAD9KWJ6_RIDPI|nr:hypothetical protein NP493_532g03011 [Ridgeia piscesae]
MTSWVRLSWSWFTGPFQLSRRGWSFPVKTTYCGHAVQGRVYRATYVSTWPTSQPTPHRTAPRRNPQTNRPQPRMILTG